MRVAAALACGPLIAAVACGPTVAFAPWLLPVPDSARQIRYSRAALQALARPPIELAEDPSPGSAGPQLVMPGATDPSLRTDTSSDAAPGWLTGNVAVVFAVAANGNVFASPYARYQVFAYEPDGILRWALQTDDPEPQLGTAIGDIKVDGHGHVYVFPYIAKGTAAQVPRPVDVFSHDGEHLYSGLIRGRLFEAAFATDGGPMLEFAWQAVEGDTVWGLAAASDGGYESVRYRLNEPF